MSASQTVLLGQPALEYMGPCQKQHLRPEEPPKNGAGGAQVFVFVKRALQVILIRTGV